MEFDATGPTEVRRVTAPGPPPPVVETRFIGRLEFEGGFPTDETLRNAKARSGLVGSGLDVLQTGCAEERTDGAIRSRCRGGHGG